MKSLSLSFQRWRDTVRRRVGRWLFDRSLVDRSVVDRSVAATHGCQIQACRRVLLIRWDAKLGDAIVSSFLFRELRKANPELSIEVVTTDAMAELFQESWQPDRLYRCNKRAGYRELARLAADIGAVDLVVHFSKQFKMKDLFFIHRLAPQHLAGLDDELSCVDIKLGQACRGLHFADKFVYLLQQCGVAEVDSRYWLPARLANEQEVKAIWPTGEHPVIAINPFGASRARKLNRTSVLRLITLLKANAPECGICLLYPPAERETVTQMVDEAGVPGLFYYQQSCTLYDLFAQLKLADGLISVDTATVHIAAGLDLPLLALYNPDASNHADWGPRNPLAQSLFSLSEPHDINMLDWCQVGEAIALLLARVNHRHPIHG
ncbi:MAG: glycosyltransferase family 9 protein [Aeromonadaceae bacterium]